MHTFLHTNCTETPASCKHAIAATSFSISSKGHSERLKTTIVLPKPAPNLGKKKTGPPEQQSYITSPHLLLHVSPSLSAYGFSPSEVTATSKEAPDVHWLVSIAIMAKCFCLLIIEARSQSHAHRNKLLRTKLI